jgi:large subunit ribosomal protein L6
LVELGTSKTRFEGTAMSRIGKKGIVLPKGVKVEANGVHVVVSGPAGKLERDIPPQITIKVEDNTVHVERKSDDRVQRAMHGLVRALLANMVQGVVSPFKKSLEITGVGYRAELKGSLLNLQVGLSHEVNHPIPKNVKCVVEKQVLVHLESPDKELLGQCAAEIRAYRKCEPYKGKGIKYVGEKILRKEGKTGAA